MAHDIDYLEDCAQTIIKAQSYLDDADFMKEVEPIIEKIKKAAERLQGFDFKGMKEMASRKKNEEDMEGYAPTKEGDIVLGESAQDQASSVPSKDW